MVMEMTEYEKKINRAMNAQKKKYGHECIFSGYHVDVVIGAHIFKRSTFPHMAAWPENIVTLSEQNDFLLEKISDPWKRICVIIDTVHISHEKTVMKQLKKLTRFILTEESKKCGFIS